MSEILVDTSIWINHFRNPSETLTSLLNREVVVIHPFVIGELACGYLHPRDKIIAFLRRLPEAVQATDDEALALLENHALYGKGLGWVDVHLLASARISKCAVWSGDQAMVRAAAVLDLEPS